MARKGLGVGKPVSHQDATVLLSTGEWVSNREFESLLLRTTELFAEQWLAKDESDPRSFLTFEDRLNKVLPMLIDATMSDFEQVEVSSNQPVHESGFRTRAIVSKSPYRIIKVKSALEGGKLSLIGVACVLLSALTLDIGGMLMALGASAKDVASVFKSLRQSWESITDPMEVEVLSAISGLISYKVINFDALGARNYNDAYARTGPTIEELLSWIAEKNQSDGDAIASVKPSHGDLQNQVRNTIRALEERQIIRQEDGHWAIVF